jgi:DNA-binding CsgD family transcriptional regulator
MAKEKPRRTPTSGLVFSEADSQTMIDLLVRASDPVSDIPLTECKRRVFDGIAQMIAACVWLWSVNQIDIADSEACTCVCDLDGGWKNSREREGALTAHGCADFRARTGKLIRKVINGKAAYTVLRRDIIDDETWCASPEGKLWGSAGMDHFIISLFPLDERSCSMVSFNRRVGELSFSQRDHAIVHLLFQRIRWLHRTDGADPSGDELVSLTRRERQVLTLLLKGLSRKRVAADLRLSEHTIADHLKEIYRKLGVKSRAELLARFIPGRSRM